jgi:choline transport protein
MSLDLPLEKDSAMASDKPNVDEMELNETVELRHQFSVWSLGSLCVCLMATWEALSTVIATALMNGGAPCLFYN